MILLLAAAGCGSDGETSGEDDGEAPASATEVTVTYWAEGRQGPSQEAVLECDPPGGTHPAPEPACSALLSHPGALEGLPPDTVCTQIYGGDQEARVTGTVRGEPVEASFSRQNGCEIDRWDTMEPLLQLEGP